MIDTRITKYPLVANRTDEQFYEDMERWVTHGANVVVDEQNQMANEINETVSSVNATAEAVENKKIFVDEKVAAVVANETNINTVASNIGDVINVGMVIKDGLNAFAPNNGYLGNKPKFVFNEAVGNEYKMLINGTFAKVNKKIIDISNLTLDFSDHMPEVTVETTTTTTVSYSKGIGYAVINNDIYRCISNAPRGVSLTDTSYFQTRNYISNQVLAYLKENGTIGYQTLIVDVGVNNYWKAPELNGWNKIKKGLYEKDGVYMTPLGIWQTLNKGAYFVGNSYGCVRHARDTSTANANSNRWYESTVYKVAKSVADSFTTASGGGSLHNNYLKAGIGSSGGVGLGRPDDKFYNIIYKEQWIPLLHSAEYDDESVEEVRNRLIANDDGIAGEVGMIEITQTLSSSSENLYFYVKKEECKDWENILKTTMYHDGSTVEIDNIVSVDDTYFNIITKAPRTRLIGSSILVTKKFPILSYIKKLSTDVIGSPENYPQEWKDVLANGKPLIGFKPNSLKPDGAIKVFKFTDKSISSDNYGVVYSSNSGISWSFTTGIDTDNVSNSIAHSPSIAQVELVSYTSKNPTLTQSDPLQIISVDNQVIGSNSHSIYKGNMLVDGSVQTGTELESRGVENIHLDNYFKGKVVYANISNAYSVKVGEYITFVGFNQTLNGVNYNNKILTLKRISNNLNNVVMPTIAVTLNPNDWELVEYFDCNITSIPTHSTINLDSTLNGYKHLICKAVDYSGMVYDAVITEEMLWDDVATSFGTSNKFTKLTNGRLTDLNGNTVKTSFSAKPTFKYKKDK